LLRFVASDPPSRFFQLFLSDRRQRLKKWGATVDFQRILGSASRLAPLKDPAFDPSGFGKG
jgi:hypothetical protein